MVGAVFGADAVPGLAGAFAGGFALAAGGRGTGVEAGMGPDTDATGAALAVAGGKVV